MFMHVPCMRKLLKFTNPFNIFISITRSLASTGERSRENEEEESLLKVKCYTQVRWCLNSNGCRWEEECA